MNKKDFKIVEFENKYAFDIENIIKRNLFEVNLKDYPRQEMEDIASRHRAKNIIRYNKGRKIYVALWKGKVVGTLSVAKSWNRPEGNYHFLTIFVDPNYHGKGIGEILVKKGEEYVKNQNGTKINVPSSKTAHGFYSKLGYSYVDKKVNDQGQYMMFKKIN